MSNKNSISPRQMLGVFFVLAMCGIGFADVDSNWHQWRGPEANGVSRTASPPLTWSETENVKWKVPIEGQGGSTPIIWEDKVFLLTVIDTGVAKPGLPAPADQPKRMFGITYPNTIHQYVVLCLDRKTGAEIWRKVATEQVPAEGHHGDNDFASSSPTTDGERLYAWFGSAGMFSYDLAGKFLWKRELGKAKTRLSFGEASSPVVYDGKLIVTRDQEEQSYITVMDAKTGETIWRKERDEPSCWATPIIVKHAGTHQLITNGHNRVRSYDLADGNLIWECGGQVSNVTPSPVATETHVICMSGYRGSSVMALPLAAKGDITGTDQIAWSDETGTPYVPSPILYDGLLFYNQTNSAVLTGVDAESGKVVMSKTRMPGIRGVYASPVGATDRIYYAGRDGATLVMARSREFKVLATNKLDERFDSSPALAGSEIFLRGEKSLYCLAEKTE